jgi:uncharacterized membrane protein YvbJ
MDNRTSCPKCGYFKDTDRCKSCGHKFKTESFQQARIKTANPKQLRIATFIIAFVFTSIAGVFFAFDMWNFTLFYGMFALFFSAVFVKSK